MPPTRRLAALALSLALLSACTTPAATTAGHKPAPSATPQAVGTAAPTAAPTPLVSPAASTAPTPTPTTSSPSPSPLPTLAPSDPVANSVLSGLVQVPRAVLAGVAGIVANNGSGALSVAGAAIISNNAGSLLSDRGAGILSNNGGGIVSNNAGAYRLTAAAAADQAPLAGVKVVLADAGGVPMLAPDGSRYEALTDAKGQFSFGSLPALPQNHLLIATLPAQRGALTAFVQRQPRPGSVVDLDLTSTLTTTYVYDQYLRGQPDPVAVLDRLPADVEAQTRAVASAAVASATALPASLVPAQVSAAVNSLRQANASFDSQLETVRQLLLVAGLSNNGVGKLATQAVFQNLDNVGVGPGGEVYFSAPFDRRVYRLDAAGKLLVAAGSGTTAAESQEGKAAGQADLGYFHQVLLLPSGGMLIIDEVEKLNRVMRVGPDGIVHELARMTTGPYARWAGVAQAPDGTVVLIGSDANNKPQLQAIAPDGKLVTLTPPAPLPPGYPQKLAFAGGSRLAVSCFSNQNYALSWPGLVADLTAFPGDPYGPALLVDLSGRLTVYQHPIQAADTPSFKIDARPFSLQRLNDDGTRLALPQPPDPFQLGTSVSVDRQGRLLIGESARVLRLDAGLVTVLAGGGQADATSPLALTSPQRCAVTPDGTIYVVDSTKLLKLDDRGGGVVANDSNLSRLAVGQGGALFGLLPQGEQLGVVRLDGATTTPLFSYGSSFSPSQLTAAPDGHLIVLSAGDLVSYEPTVGATPTVLAHLPEAQLLNLVASPLDGSVYFTSCQTSFSGSVTSPAHLYHVPAGGGTPTLVGTDVRFADGFSGGMAADSKGRLFFVSRAEFSRPILNRFDPADGSFKAIAGAGTELFNGTGGVDTSLQLPLGMSFAPNGDLIFVDSNARQVRRIPAASAAAS